MEDYRILRSPENSLRYESWHLLAFLHSQFQRLWLCLRDFNEILSVNEKLGVSLVPSNKWRVLGMS